MLRDIFINMTIMVSFICLTSQFISTYELDTQYSIKTEIIVGITAGVLGTILMAFGINLGDGTVLDLRHVGIVLVAIHGGTVAAVISGIIIVLYRIVFFPVTISSLWGIGLIIITTVTSILIARLNISEVKKWIYATLCNLFFLTTTLALILRDEINIFNFLLVYPSATVILTAIIAYYTNYCITTNNLYRKFKIESQKDFLTGLNNVRNFDDLLNYAIENAKAKNKNLSLLMIDIDFFKKVNDTYGHGEGNRVLRELGTILTENSRSFDIVSRNGGEEFTVLLFDCPKSHAMEIAERIRYRVQNHRFILSNRAEITITVSIGVASYPDTTTDIDKLLEEADIALYAAKRTGRNKVCLDDQCIIL